MACSMHRPTTNSESALPTTKDTRLTRRSKRTVNMKNDKTCMRLTRPLCKYWKRCTFHRVFDLRTRAKTHYMRPDLKLFRYDSDANSQQLRWSTLCGIDIGYRISSKTIDKHIHYNQHKARLVFETLTAWQHPPIFPSEDPNHHEDPWIYRAPEDPEAVFDELCKRS